MQQYLDTALGVTAVSSPIWLQHLAEGLEIYVLLGGAVLITLRVWRTYKRTYKRSTK